MWKWVGPIVMLIIFISSLIRAIVIPPSYELYDDVSTDFKLQTYIYF